MAPRPPGKSLCFFLVARGFVAFIPAGVFLGGVERDEDRVRVGGVFVVGDLVPGGPGEAHDLVVAEVSEEAAVEEEVVARFGDAGGVKGAEEATECVADAALALGGAELSTSMAKLVRTGAFGARVWTARRSAERALEGGHARGRPSRGRRRRTERR